MATLANLTHSHNIETPSKLLYFTEAGRATLGLGIYFATNKLLRRVPQGDGHPVIVIPGFMTNDLSTYLLRKFLRKKNYHTYAWKLGVNLGYPEQAEQAAKRVEALWAKHNTPVSIIGWSLGGVFAREIARQNPTIVRQVITLSSPFGGLFEKNNNARWIYDLIHGEMGLDVDKDTVKDILTPPPVPNTAIFSKEDGIVPWQYCMERELDLQTENVQVTGSHFGLGHNPAVINCIADRLSQPLENWQSFNPTGLTKLMYYNF